MDASKGKWGENDNTELKRGLQSLGSIREDGTQASWLGTHSTQEVGQWSERSLPVRQREIRRMVNERIAVRECNSKGGEEMNTKLVWIVWSRINGKKVFKTKVVN